jgi:hypothetical protein
MRYAHRFWEIFGVPADRWGDMPYADFLWMRAAVDDHERMMQQETRRDARAVGK